MFHPLGTAHGRLVWLQVRPEIPLARGEPEDVNIIVYEPTNLTN